MSNASRLAFDRSSVRTIDADGKLHVEISNISKACVNPYLGKEIPDSEVLGLDPDKVYHLFRDPDELAKGAHTFNNLPLLDVHVPFTANNYDPADVVGATGSHAAFEVPYLKNSLIVWSAEAIKKIEDESQKEISSAYRYTPDMVAGTYEGTRYDGVMRNIIGNHVALVEAGRAGPDVVVGDSKLEIAPMAKAAPLKSKTALFVQGMLRPRLTAAGRVALDGALKDVTGKTFVAKKPDLLKVITKDVIAKDADLTAVHKLLDSLDDEQGRPAADEDDMIEDAEPKEIKDKPAEDEDDDEPRKFLKSKLSAEDMAAHDEMCAAKAAKDAALAGTEGGKAPDAATMAKTDKIPGMDAKIQIAKDSARNEAIAEMNAIHDAEREVRPFIGDLKQRPATAAAVYKLALDSLSVDLTDVPATAYRAILRTQPKPGARPTVIAKDSAATAPKIAGLDRIRVA